MDRYYYNYSAQTGEWREFEWHAPQGEPLPPYRDEDEFFVAPRQCETCNGTGDIVHLLDVVAYYGDEAWEVCFDCSGTGEEQPPVDEDELRASLDAL